MYDNSSARTRVSLRHAVGAVAFVSLACALAAPARSQGLEQESVVRKISGLSEKLELTTNTSRILTMEKNIPRVQVNNPELVKVTPLSARDIQISAKKAGVTQVNLWDEEGNIHSVDVMIYGDARELAVALQTQFPNSSIKVYRYSDSLVLKGFVDQPENVTPIMRLAEDYAPKIINNMIVGGAQQVLLKVKVMEVSRTQLRRVGSDWAYLTNGGGFAIQGVSDLIRGTGTAGSMTTTGGDTLRFGIVNGNDAFFGILDLMNQNDVAKILAEPSIVAISGRAARFSSGGEVPILIPQSLGTTSIEYKEFGTIVDFVPIVLGNGKIHLEVYPEVSTVDPALGIDLDNIRVPGFRQRRAHTAVEMQAGQTFILAGLVEERSIAGKKGLPWVSDLPAVGVPFRKTNSQVDEIETLIMVTPEFVDPLDPHQVPCNGPGTYTTYPTACQLHCAGHVEVPTYVNPTGGLMSCGTDPCGPCANCGQCGGGNCGCGPSGGCQCNSAGPMITEGVRMPGGVGYDDAGPTLSDEPLPAGSRMTPSYGPMPTVPEDLSLPLESAPPAPGGPAPNNGASHYLPPRQPAYMRNVSRPHNPQQAAGGAQAQSGQSGLIGPVGYDQ